MVKAGVPLPETMSAAIQGANNKVFEQGLVTARERMLEGEGLAEPIGDTHLFPRAATQMMRVGEDTGTLDVQLENAAEYYGRELEYKLKKLTSLFEPAVIIFMGLIVGFVAVALDLGDVRRVQLLEDAPHRTEEIIPNSSRDPYRPDDLCRVSRYLEGHGGADGVPPMKGRNRMRQMLDEFGPTRTTRTCSSEASRWSSC